MLFISKKPCGCPDTARYKCDHCGSEADEMMITVSVDAGYGGDGDERYDLCSPECLVAGFTPPHRSPGAVCNPTTSISIEGDHALWDLLRAGLAGEVKP